VRVLMNGLPTLKRKTGVGHYVAELHAALARQFPADEFTLTPGDFARAATRQLPRASGGSSGGQRSPIQSAVTGLVKRAARDAAALHFAAYSRHFPFDIYHETNFVPPPTGLPTVLNVHDLSVLLYPEWHPADRVGHHRRKFLDGLRRADRVLTISDAVKRELVTHCGTDPARVTTIYCGVGPEFRPHSADELAAARRRLDLPDRYFLSVGTVEPRKNLAMLFAAYCDLPDGVRSRVPLLVAGPWGWKSEPVRDFYESVGKAKGIRHLGYVADGDRPALYASATALVYPSFYEGFGLPPAEMLACGGRVIASTADAVREVCGDVAEYLDPADRDAWRATLLAAAKSPEGSAEVLTARVRRASLYTWDRAAVETRTVYDAVIRASGRG
jgi:glycosyltransferase involved in cell wall biosynthesis